MDGMDEEEDSRGVNCKRHNSHFLRYVLISPEAITPILFEII